MSFNILPSSLVITVAEPIQQYCIQRFGRAGLKLETGIKQHLNWAPTIQVKRSSSELVAIEVSNDLYPFILKMMSHDIREECSEIPIAIYVACPLESYVADTKQTTVRQLKEHGFGLLTVDDQQHVTEQFGAIPIIHHISSNEINGGIKNLPAPVKIRFKDAFDVYRTNSYQGLQESGQLVEGLVFCLAKQCHEKGWIASKPLKGQAADILDAMYEASANELRQQRAALGKARSFLKYYRNVASHAPKSLKDTAMRIKVCRQGFVESLGTASELAETHKKLGFKIKLYFP